MRTAKSYVTVMPRGICTYYDGDIAWLTYLPLLQHWLFLPTWLRNIHLHH